MLAIIALGGGCAATSARSVAAAGPVTSGLAAADVSAEGLARLDGLMEEAVARRDVPGAVLLVVHRGRTVYRRAFGLSQLVPEPRPMKADMIFDLASLTKPIATASAVMKLVESGRIRLWDRVRLYVPEFSVWYGEKGVPGEEARLFHLLTHTSGLPPYTDAEEAGKALGVPCSTADLVGLIARLPKEGPVGTSFVYSCLNYITLAHIVRQVSGKPLDEFTSETVFGPLGMTRTFFRPPAETVDECVPTEVINGIPLRGVVHDPLARLQGGVSGNAGLFSTADDLARFARMVLSGGVLDGVRVLSPLAVERMTEIFPQLPGAGRGLGWDIDTDYATVRGDLFGPASYGHSGYTGTSIWIDPETRTAIVFLTNRVHPDDKGDIIALRSKVANIVAAAIRTR
ncbi:MAG: beta-lactamase family protein [Candidatus Aminicenantes bacterium]|nr:beta-lactamase family protein [Candidatus Aminicenantes bacterium]